ncbi:SO2930 family diheme c-type cytochrome [Candidatus Uabimicrobium amorphum]|uniref:Uncharacterized protein n=1 Tax=Uabimicrobium amorphum TaxID=2596890 RepID=A0A5S9F320_UABAM|nr:SO2930 family diheme c-type cytochrome [Candidatus Uabimicrobium amorphum]BBM82954.1 hypothetical protein UABAM_01297 [Candidatus Uabimicrobium amorphum]
MYRVFIFIFLFVLGCSQEPHTKEFSPHNKLSDYGFFMGKIREQIPQSGVIPYELNTPLFSDYTNKKRFIYLPPNSAIEYRPSDILSFPQGSILIKTFSLAHDMTNNKRREKILETRLLVNTKQGWKAYPYIWNSAQDEAYLELVGDIFDVSWIDKNGQRRTNNYVVPNVNDCKGCHFKNDKIQPIGPQAKHLNTSGQLQQWQKMGHLKKVPAQDIPQIAVWNDENADINDRARAYLDINCAHCHNLHGPASNAGLDLRSENLDRSLLGIYKSPVAAGHGTGGLSYDIFPGKPQKSILLYRMQSTDPKIAMPELGRGVVHEEGVLLITQWIENMKETKDE